MRTVTRNINNKRYMKIRSVLFGTIVLHFEQTVACISYCFSLYFELLLFAHLTNVASILDHRRCIHFNCSLGNCRIHFCTNAVYIFSCCSVSLACTQISVSNVIAILYNATMYMHIFYSALGLSLLPIFTFHAKLPILTLCC